VDLVGIIIIIIIIIIRKSVWESGGIAPFVLNFGTR